MLHELRAFFRDPDDDAFARVDSFEFTEADAVLVLSLKRVCQESWTRFRVRARQLLDCAIHEPHGDLWVFERDHVLARLQTDTRQDLMFRGVPASVGDVVHGLVGAHLELLRDWIPFSRYMNSADDLGWLLKKGYGKLAGGPTFMMESYAAVLEAHGVEPALLPPRPALRPATEWEGSHFVAAPSQAATLLIGDSFLVAEAFDSSPLGDEPG